jgi:hypothetical protein
MHLHDRVELRILLIIELIRKFIFLPVHGLLPLVVRLFPERLLVVCAVIGVVVLIPWPVLSLTTRLVLVCLHLLQIQLLLLCDMLLDQQEVVSQQRQVMAKGVTHLLHEMLGMKKHGIGVLELLLHLH